MTDFTGTAGNDKRNGTNGADTFDMSQGGNDTVHGRGGADVIDFGATFDVNDHVFGGGGFDTLKLSGGFSISDTFLVDSIEKVVVADGFNYGLFFAASTIAAGQTMTVDGHALTGGNFLYVDSQNEDGRFVITGGDSGDIMFTGNGNDVINGGGGNDSINPGDGTDTVNAGDGNDLIIFSSNGKLDALDRIDGGDAGPNTISLFGDYSAGLVFGANTIKNITEIDLNGGFDYSLTLANATLPANFIFIVDGTQLGASDTMQIDGSGAHYHQYSFKGGAGDDVLIGGGGYDTFVGGLGADTTTGNGGPDAFQYDAAAESTGRGYDTLAGFDALDDFIFPGFTVSPGTVSGFDGKISQGKLSTAHFNADLENAVGAGQLGADHAALFQPDSGTLQGKLFLIVDGNNTAGFQAGEDLVVLFPSPRHMADFDITNFGNAG